MEENLPGVSSPFKGKGNGRTFKEDNSYIYIYGNIYLLLKEKRVCSAPKSNSFLLRVTLIFEMASDIRPAISCLLKWSRFWKKKSGYNLSGVCIRGVRLAPVSSD